MPNGFLERVRMANIYRPERRYEYDEPRFREPRFEESRMGRVPQIAQQVAAPTGSTPPMNVVLGDQGFQSGTEILRQSFAKGSPEFELKKEALDVEREKARLGFGFKERQLDIQKQRADAYTFKAQNPNAIIREVGGRMVAINPQNPSQTVDLGDSRFMDEADKIALEQTGRVELEGVRQTGRKEIQEMRGQQDKDEIKERARLKGEEELLPTQQIKQAQHKYNILINRKPELRDFVELDASGMPIIEPPGKGFFGRATGPTPEQFEEINQFIFGTTDKKPTKTETPPKSEAVQTGIATMRTPDGREIQVPADKVEEAKKRGATVVTTRRPPGMLPPMELVPSHRR